MKGHSVSSEGRLLGVTQRLAQRERDTTVPSLPTLQTTVSGGELSVGRSERTPADAPPLLGQSHQGVSAQTREVLSRREIALAQVKRRRAWGSRRKPGVVCGVWTQKTGFLGSAQSNTVWEM